MFQKKLKNIIICILLFEISTSQAGILQNSLLPEPKYNWFQKALIKYTPLGNKIKKSNKEIIKKVIITYSVAGLAITLICLGLIISHFRQGAQRPPQLRLNWQSRLETHKAFKRFFNCTLERIYTEIKNKDQNLNEIDNQELIGRIAETKEMTKNSDPEIAGPAIDSLIALYKAQLKGFEYINLDYIKEIYKNNLRINDDFINLPEFRNAINFAIENDIKVRLDIDDYLGYKDNVERSIFSAICILEDKGENLHAIFGTKNKFDIYNYDGLFKSWANKRILKTKTQETEIKTQNTQEPTIKIQDEQKPEIIKEYFDFMDNLYNTAKNTNGNGNAGDRSTMFRKLANASLHLEMLKKIKTGGKNMDGKDCTLPNELAAKIVEFGIPKFDNKLAL